MAFVGILTSLFPLFVIAESDAATLMLAVGPGGDMLLVSVEQS